MSSSARSIKLNAELRRTGEEPIGVSLYTSDAATEGQLEYVDRQLSDLSIPVEDTERGRDHDLSFHVPSIEIPRDAFEYSAERSRFGRAFLEYAKTKFAGDPAKLGAIQVYEKLFDAASSFQSDSANGGISYSIAGHAAGEFDIEDQMSQVLYRHIASDYSIRMLLRPGKAFPIPTPIKSLSFELEGVTRGFDEHLAGIVTLLRRTSPVSRSPT